MKSALKSPRNSYRKLLLKKRDELLATFRLDPEALTISIRTPDEVEFASKTAEQGVTAATVALRRQMLKEVEKALARVVGGTYGLCEGCGQEISSSRLNALPWARYCLICQELRSRN